MLSFIPDSLKQALLDGLVNFLAGQADRLTDGMLGERLRGLASDGVLRRAMNTALQRAVARFEREYAEIDDDLVADIRATPHFWEQAEVRGAVLDLVARPGAWSEAERSAVVSHFASVLPSRRNRERVDRAVSYLLRCAAEEIWTIPAAKEIREVYTLQLQRHSVEAMQREIALAEQRLQAEQHGSDELRAAVLALLEAQQHHLPLLAAGPATAPRPRPWHNLPPVDPSPFRGRAAELSRLRALLALDERAWQILILGMGGVGKSALARMMVQEYVERYQSLPEAERFEAIVWVSAKEEVLTASGAAPAAPEGLIFHTLDDVYASIAQVLDRADIVQALPGARDHLARQALAAQRTLLIVDNFESVADARVHGFIRQLPPPTKVLITSRTWVDAAATVRLAGLPHDEALALLKEEAKRRGVVLQDADAAAIVQACAGLPLPLHIAVARLESGERSSAVLRWLGSASGDLLAYCVQSQAELARARDPHSWPLLIVCTLCDRDAGASRALLAAATGLPADACDTATAELQRLSLLTPLAVERVTLLPLVERYVQSVATTQEVSAVAERWLQWMLTFAANVTSHLDMRIALVQTVAREYPNLRDHHVVRRAWPPC